MDSLDFEKSLIFVADQSFMILRHKIIVSKKSMKIIIVEGVI